MERYDSECGFRTSSWTIMIMWKYEESIMGDFSGLWKKPDWYKCCRKK